MWSLSVWLIANAFGLWNAIFGGETGKKNSIVIGKKKSVIIKTIRDIIKLRMSSTNTVIPTLDLCH